MDHPGGVAGGGGVKKVTERIKFHSHCSWLQICHRHARIGGGSVSAEVRLICGGRTGLLSGIVT